MSEPGLLSYTNIGLCFKGLCKFNQTNCLDVIPVAGLFLNRLGSTYLHTKLLYLDTVFHDIIV